MANITNEVLAAKLDATIEGQKDLKKGMDDLAARTVDRQIYEIKHAELEKEISAIKLDIIKLQNKKSFLAWLVPLISAVLGSVFTYLIVAKLSEGV